MYLECLAFELLLGPNMRTVHLTSFCNYCTMNVRAEIHLRKVNVILLVSKKTKERNMNQMTNKNHEDKNYE